MRLVLLLIFLIALPVSIYLISHPVIFFGQAKSEDTPKQIKISNITDNSFTVSYLTPDKQTTGFIEYGTTDKFGEIAQDDRDKQILASRYTHHVTLKKLKPSTKYFFRVGSGDKKFENGGVPFNLVTAPISSTPPVPDLIFGKIIKTEGDDVLVYALIGEATPLSTYVRSDGNWLITLNNARTKDLQQYLIIKSEDKINLQVTSGKLESKSIISATQRSPVPPISLGSSETPATVSTNAERSLTCTVTVTALTGVCGKSDSSHTTAEDWNCSSATDYGVGYTNCTDEYPNCYVGCVRN